MPQEEHEFEPVEPLISDDTTHPGAMPRGIDASRSDLNGRTPPQLPWATLGRLPSKPVNGHGMREALSQHRGSTNSDTASAPRSWDSPPNGAQLSPKSRLNGSVAPRLFLKEGAGESMSRNAAATSPLPVTRDGPKGHVAFENSQQRNKNAIQNDRASSVKSSVRLPWESMLDGIPSKPEKGPTGMSQQDKGKAVTRQSGLNELPNKIRTNSGRGAEGRLNGLNGQLADSRRQQV